MKKIYVNPQWQGGADLSTYNGAEEIKRYLTGSDYAVLPVATDKTDIAVKKNGIKGFDALQKQMQLAYNRIQTDSPDKIFTLGGGCDADVPPVVYLCEKYQGDLTLIWLDAHGDLNTPNESVSSLFYGMPLRSVMDNKCFGLLKNTFPLDPTRIIHIGGRDFDESEKAFINKTGMTAYSVQDLRLDSDLIRKVAEGVHTNHIYIHLDLDVIDPSEFPNTPLPVAGGVFCTEVNDILQAFSDKLAGLGVYEYAPIGIWNPFVDKLIRFGVAF